MSGGGADSATRVEAFRAQVVERIARLNVVWIQLEQAEDRELIFAILRELHTVKGEASLFGFLGIADVAHALEERIQAAPPGALATIGDWVLSGFDLLDRLAGLAPTERPAEVDVFAAESVAALPVGASPAHPIATTSAASGPAVPAGGLPGDGERAKASEALRVTAEQLDRMRTVVGDLLLSRTRLTTQALDLRRVREAAVARPETRALGEHLAPVESALRDDILRVGDLIGALEDVILAMRMVPLSSIFDRYPRVVRDLGRQLGRQARLELEGETVEADRDVLEGLHEPLLHLIRNAMDHGVEPPEARARAGKDPTGTLTMAARIEGDLLHLSVGDDGSGVDLDAVRRRAIERGQLEAQAAETASDGELAELLFLPGMTTREEVTQVSGRGVGLDVVKQSIVGLGGSVRLVSTRGVGTRFDLTVPVSTAITSMLLFEVGEGRYGLPAGAVIALRDAAAAPVEVSISGPCVRHDGRTVPLIDLGVLLGEPTRNRDGRLMIVRTSTGPVAVAGSHRHEQRDAVLKTGAFVRGARLVNAAVGLEDGRIALVLQPDALRGTATARPAALATGTGVAPRVRTALVVEDSAVVRDLLAEALRSYGIHVLEAGDGVEGLERLAEAAHVDVVVTDIDMPRMDGLAMIRALRARPGPRVPAVVVSSRGRDDDKAAAMGVGADAYLVKSQFSRDGLWSLVERFLRG